MIGYAPFHIRSTTNSILSFNKVVNGKSRLIYFGYNVFQDQVKLARLGADGKF